MPRLPVTKLNFAETVIRRAQELTEISAEHGMKNQKFTQSLFRLEKSLEELAEHENSKVSVDVNKIFAEGL